ncbi:radical SAM protein, partial [Candidatus Pacearchaeota archaeon]|nr:radical SAM protein [Candidatus Pacearchaeota archaeon]
EIPFIGGIVINDKCNLNCLYCSVSNRNIPDLSYNEISKGLNDLYDKGMKYLYIEGGEPFLWKDNSKNLEDIIHTARDIGFRFITLYTNGTFPIETKADTVFVSLDGWGQINDAIRGKSFDKIITNIKNSSHKKIIINCTLTSKNKDEIENFCKALSKIKNIKGVFFYFYTPYNSKDSLYLGTEERKTIIKTILKLKQKDYKILNSKAALKSVYNNSWKRPNGLSWLFAENKLYKCCRMIGNDAVCKDCGYLGFAEIYHITRLNLNAVFTAFKYM